MWATVRPHREDEVSPSGPGRESLLSTAIVSGGQIQCCGRGGAALSGGESCKVAVGCGRELTGGEVKLHE